MEYTRKKQRKKFQGKLRESIIVNTRLKKAALQPTQGRLEMLGNPSKLPLLTNLPHWQICPADKFSTSINSLVLTRFLQRFQALESLDGSAERRK
jgi:hypothetical protein